MNIKEGYKPVIGLEIHVQLATKSKMFSSAPCDPNEKTPNTNIDEVVTGEPGTLPVINKEAVSFGMMVGLALNCKIPEYSKFDRKHYFYPDLPKGYQISQLDHPVAGPGYLDIVVQGKTKRVRITRAHLEEDAGKNTHPEGLPYSLIDYNRAGCPLLEIVTEPDIETAEEARIFLQELRTIVRYVGASSADMENGTMRCEPNISVRKPGEESLPKYKVEVKNINSFKFAEAAINYEISRHIEMLEKGEMPLQQTMGWNEKLNQTVAQRTKGEANDYRYMPEPDIPELHFTSEFIEQIQSELPELPSAKRARFKEEYGLLEADFENLIAWKELNYFFENVISELDSWLISEGKLSLERENVPGINDSIISESNEDNRDPSTSSGWQRQTQDGNVSSNSLRIKLIKQCANWCLQDFSAMLNAQALSPEASNVTPENIAELVVIVDDGKISSAAAKQVFKVMFDVGGEPDSIVEDLGLAQVSDESAIEESVNFVLDSNPKAVEDFKAGQQRSFGFLVGQVMAHMKGKGNPQIVNELIKKKLQ